MPVATRLDDARVHAGRAGQMVAEGGVNDLALVVHATDKPMLRPCTAGSRTLQHMVVNAISARFLLIFHTC